MIDPSILVGSTPVSVGTTDSVTDPVDQLRQALQLESERATEAESYARVLAAAVEMQAELEACTDLESAAFTYARRLAQVMPAERVQIAWRDSETSLCRLVADTAPTDVDHATKFSAAAEEICARAAITHLPPTSNSNRHSLLAVAQYAEASAATAVLAAPLKDVRGTARGAVIAFNDTPMVASETLIDLTSRGLSGKLSSLEVMQPRSWEKIVRSVTATANRSRRRIGAAVAACVVLAMLVPATYRVKAACELQPVQRRFVAAPFDGPLQSVLVRPGDSVEAGDVLAKMNPREIEFELAGVRAELNRAIQEKKGMMVDHDFGGSKIATLEVDRLRAEQELLKYQRNNLEIRSPLAGVVVAGDLKQSEGTPLAKGEVMFEIAPLGENIVEIAIPESDIAHVRVGMPVEFYLHALPSEKLSGTLQHVHPQAELKDHDNVFIGEVLLVDDSGALRPGMRGRSWVSSDRHTLGWNLFHKAFYSVRTSVGW